MFAPSRCVRFKVEGVVPGLGVVIVRVLDEADFRVAVGSTLGGCRVKGCDQPRVVRSGSVDLEVFGMFLEDPGDIVRFAVGDTTLLETPAS